MKRTIKVFVGGEPRWVGTLHYDAVGSRERSAFAYAGTWRRQRTDLRLSPRFHWWQVRNFIAKSQTVPFFMGQLLIRSLMAGPGWISEDTGPEATIEALLSVLRYFRISRARAKEILSRIVRAVSRWRETALSLGMTNQELDQFAEAFEHPESEAARKAAKRGG